LAWIGLGVALGFGGLAKYQAALAAGSALLYWTLQQGWRDRLHRRGLLWAAAIALLIVSPHLNWVITHDFLPIQYARRNSHVGALTMAQCSAEVLRWLGNQIAQLAGALVFGVGLLVWQRGRNRDDPSHRNARQDLVQPDAQAFLRCWGLLPLILMMGLGIAAQAHLHTNWAAAFMPLTCAALMGATGWHRWSRTTRSQALAAFAIVQALLVAHLCSRQLGQPPAFDQHRSALFASQAVVDAIAPTARAAIGGPVRVIAGRQRLASVLALRFDERPLLLIDGRPELSPWMPRAMNTFCAVLWVGDASDLAPADLDRHEAGHGLWWAVELTGDRAYDCL
jgi:4-amino-4-deoxy-L-arabinose transferase-like glycosyltransferase